MQTLEQLGKSFRTFAADPTLASSPLYRFLSEHIAADDALLELSAEVRDGQPAPNILLGAVHRVLLDEKKGGQASEAGRALAPYYASMLDMEQAKSPDTGAFDAFKAFVVSKRDHVLELVRTQLVRTNEVRRCTYLFPALTMIAARTGGRPLTLIEIGCSAGFNLLPDCYGYRYYAEDGKQIVHRREPPTPREPASQTRTPWAKPGPLSLATRLVGDLYPDFKLPEMKVERRIGFDIQVRDAGEAENMEWLCALIWPEEFRERVRRLESAARSVAAYRKELVLREGDGVELLAVTLPALPEDCLPVVYHTHVANQLSQEERAHLHGVLRENGCKRPVVHLANNLAPGSILEAFFIEPGGEEAVELAEVDGHADWIKWLHRA